MTTLTIESEESVDELFDKVQNNIISSGFSIKDLDKDHRIHAEGSKNFSWGLMVLLILFLVLGAIIYWAASDRKSITATFREKDGKTIISIITYGDGRHNLLIHELKRELE